MTGFIIVLYVHVIYKNNVFLRHIIIGKTVNALAGLIVDIYFFVVGAGIYFPEFGYQRRDGMLDFNHALRLVIV